MRKYYKFNAAQLDCDFFHLCSNWTPDSFTSVILSLWCQLPVEKTRAKKLKVGEDLQHAGWALSAVFQIQLPQKVPQVFVAPVISPLDISLKHRADVSSSLSINDLQTPGVNHRWLRQCQSGKVNMNTPIYIQAPLSKTNCFFFNISAGCSVF